MLDLTTFRAQYPEFQSAPDPLVQAFLDRAAVRIDATVWGSWTNEGHGLLTAHLLAMAPNGQFSRLQNDKGQTTYGVEFNKLEAGASSTIRVF